MGDSLQFFLNFRISKRIQGFMPSTVSQHHSIPLSTRELSPPEFSDSLAIDKVGATSFFSKYATLFLPLLEC